MRPAPAQKFRAAAQVRFRKMRMIKTNDRNFQRTADRNGFPPNLVWVARFDDVGVFALQDLFDRTQI